MTAEPRVAGLVLAAGAGRRFGGPKAVVELDGERLVDRAVRVLAEAAVSPVVVVSGAAPFVVDGAQVVHNDAWDEGIGSSLRAGLCLLSDDASADAVVVVLVDQPRVGSAAVARVLGAVAGPGALAVATYGGRRSHPVLLGRDHWGGVCETARGDVGARSYLSARPDDVREVECGDVADDTDLDTPEDLARLGIR